ncbi:ketol-acid reductoisomerase [Marinicella rhabdoformis]|uniref:ketol-acid reductoisomerase n=1 Tax=Marinicella rhabdoformis TaxID=2580566 RepID=UPI0012AED1FF|nr:ketol-acid reductoisomerase [Marinicella rhabdoformis]
MAKINFGGTWEQVVTREEYPLTEAQAQLKNKTIAVLGYGVQGPGQALNLRDNGLNVIVGQRADSSSWDKAVADGWQPGVNLFDVATAAKKADVVMNLLSDAGQIAAWPQIKVGLNAGDTLYFSHGFGITFHDQTDIIPPENVDVVLVAPKGSGTSLRRLFLDKKGLNSSYAVFQDFTGEAQQTAVALGMAIGSGYLFETDFEKEVYSDLTGERGILMGALAGLFEAQYEVLRHHGHSPSEAFNETVEELTQSLMPLVAEKGMDWMYANTSATAQRGALDWRHKFREANVPLFESLYQSVASGQEAERVIAANQHDDYRLQLNEELQTLRESELWQTGLQVRKLRPEQGSEA